MIPILALTAILCICNSVTGQEFEFKNHVDADGNGKYHIYWSVIDQNITIQVEVENKGWVGFGFNQKPIMKDADIVIGWVYPNGTTVLTDRNGQGFFEPLIDAEQNYELLEGRENETHTILRFTRLLNTCDKDDKEITDDTIRFIFSWHPDDPQQLTGFPGHGAGRVGSRQVYLLSPQPSPVTLTDEIVVWDMHMPNITIPPKKTTYWCHYVKIPDYDDALDYIGYSINITPGNEMLVHHYMFFACTANISYYEEMVKTNGYQCITENVLNDPMECQPPLVIWAYGAKGQMLPEGVGIPIGAKSNAAVYFVFQVHYTNKNETVGIRDSSGMKLYLTKKRKPIRAATLQFYSPVDYTAVIPPKQTAFKWASYCPPECTQKAFPPEGINVFAVGLHTHLAGRKIHMRHFRGKQELAPISSDDNYDFNYQEMRQLAKPAVVLPGDLLMAECTYETMDRNTTVVGGYSTMQEMCFLYLTYYPAVPLSLCLGGPTIAEMSDYFGVKIGPDKLHIESPPEHFKESMFDYLDHYDWSKVSEDKVQKLYEIQYNSTKHITCQDAPVTKEGTKSYTVDYPADSTFYVPPDVCADPKVASEKPTKVDSYPYEPPAPPQSYETPKPQQYYEETTPKPGYY